VGAMPIASQSRILKKKVTCVTTRRKKRVVGLFWARRRKLSRT
jgi:hypothetical protein